MSLRPTPLATDVSDRFLDACKELPGVVKPAFHGTNAANLESIYTLGLVIPGRGNEIKVANGTAHGRGIYTATMDNAMLSWGFARGAAKPMLVCAVLDDAEHMLESQRIGNLQVTAESVNVRHVGNAMVVFDPQRVVPLYVVTHKGVNYGGSTYVRVQRSAGRFWTQQQIRRSDKMRKKPALKAIPLTGASAFLSRRAAQKYRQG